MASSPLRQPQLVGRLRADCLSEVFWAILPVPETTSRLEPLLVAISTLSNAASTAFTATLRAAGRLGLTALTAALPPATLWTYVRTSLGTPPTRVPTSLAI